MINLKSIACLLMLDWYSNISWSFDSPHAFRTHLLPMGYYDVHCTTLQECILHDGCFTTQNPTKMNWEYDFNFPKRIISKKNPIVNFQINYYFQFEFFSLNPNYCDWVPVPENIIWRYFEYRHLFKNYENIQFFIL